MNNVPPSVETAVLNERMNRVLLLADGMAGSIREIHQRLGELPVVQRDIVALDEKAEQLLVAITAMQEVARGHGISISALNTIWRVFSGVGMTICITLAGFAWNTIKDINKEAIEIRQRVSLTEYQLRVIANEPKGKN